MTRLPIDEALPDLLSALAPSGAAPRSAVLVAPTGAGKTTRVPPALASTLDGAIWMTEPRRVAARAAARRIAEEKGSRVGAYAGYHVRFDRRVGRDTRVVVMTEGILVRRLQSDPFLEGVSAIVFDEFHERHLDADLGLALARKIQREVRPDLVLVVMSATIAPEPLADWLGGATTVRSLGRSWPVDVQLQPRADQRSIEHQAADAVRHALQHHQGDILVFLPGVGEIRRTQELLGATREAAILPLHGRQSPEEQDAAIAPSNRRKVVLATNVAESSLTIPGVRVVIDSGWARVLRFDASVGLDRLVLERIARDSADQRAGRAGREAPGHCIRLWDSATDARLSDRLEPEIHRAELSGVALQLLQWGERPHEYDGFEPPPQALWDAATKLLELLHCTHEGHPVALGRAAAALPVSPRLACVLLAGRDLGVLDRAARFAASISGRSPDVDATARLLVRALGDLEHEETDRGDEGGRDGLSNDERFFRAVLAGFSDRVALRREPESTRAKMTGGAGVVLRDATQVDRQYDLFTCVEVVPPERGGTGESVVRMAFPVRREWLDAAHLSERIEVLLDRDTGTVGARRVCRYLDLELSRTSAPLPPGTDTGQLLTEVAAADPESTFAVDALAFARLRQRIAWTKRASSAHQLELATLPPIGVGELGKFADELCMGARSVAELRRLDLAGWARRRFPGNAWAQLDRLAPDTVRLPTGRDARIQYPGDGDPFIEARIQELFGLTETPRILDGRAPVVVHLLAPNGRPQQVTRDLHGFWENHYAEVRKELRGRYPKHDWPEDPLVAPPSRGPKRRK